MFGPDLGWTCTPQRHHRLRPNLSSQLIALPFRGTRPSVPPSVAGGKPGGRAVPWQQPRPGAPRPSPGAASRAASASPTAGVVRRLMLRREFEEAAALANEEEAEALRRTPEEQLAGCLALARARTPQEVPEEVQPLVAPTRSWQEQRARCEELSRRPPVAACPPAPLPEVRSASAQQRHCAELAQPRAPPENPRPKEDAFWRDRLAARASALVPSDAAAARLLLAEMRAGGAQPGAGAGCGGRTRPPGQAPPAGCPARCGAPAGPPSEEAEALLGQLREAVEEVLWVALLVLRSCTKAMCGSAEGDRLLHLLSSVLGPPLRPVVRGVPGALGGGPAVRRLCDEFPRLASQLRLRADGACGGQDRGDGAPPSWSAPELEAHLTEVLSCRDTILAMDVASAARHLLQD